MRKDRNMSLWTPRPQRIVLTNVQKKYLERINRTLLECSHELYHHDLEQASDIGEKYWKLLGVYRKINVSQWPEEPWFPGALAWFSEEELRNRKDLVVINPNALESENVFILSVMTVVIKPEVDQGVVVSQVGNTASIQFDPLQNLHVFILPEQDLEHIPGIKEIKFNEDYQYLMINPDMLQNLVAKNLKQPVWNNLYERMIRFLRR